MLTTLLTILTWKMAIYVAVLLSLVWRITTLTKRVELLKANLGTAQDSIQRLKDLSDDAYDVKARLQHALSLSEQRYSQAIRAVSQFVPPESAEDCFRWLNSPEAKG